MNRRQDYSHLSKYLLLLLGFLFLAGCGIDRTVDPLTKAELALLEEYKNLDIANRMKIANEDEPGDKLLVCLKIVDRESNKELADQSIHLYHTSSSGEYEESDPSDESTARLNGKASTDWQGRIFVESILPGDYGSSSDNRHIHTTVVGARPEAYDIHFRQYATFMGRRFISGSDQHFLAELKTTADGNLVTFLTIEAKLPR